VERQRALERVYWQRRLWPSVNPLPKPPLEAVLAEPELIAKVEDGMKKSSALELYWRRSITPGQLQAELQRMARDTRNPELLGELWGALGNDPYLIAEVLARPLLADRLLRSYYSADQRFHGALRARVAAELESYGGAGQLRLMSGTYREVVLRLEDGRGEAVPRARSAAGEVPLHRDEWEAELTQLRSLFATNASTALPLGPAPGWSAEQAIPLAKLSPLQEDQERFYAVEVLSFGSSEIRLATVEWRKQPFEDWWRQIEGGLSAEIPVYDFDFRLPEVGVNICADDAWSPIRSLPAARDGHVAAWTGTEMLVWGGILFGDATGKTGGRYDPATETWHPMTGIDDPTGRTNFAGVWTGTELIIWGGWGGGTVSNVFNTGGLYNPITDAWTPTSTGAGVPAARDHHSAVWTGTEMIVWGGSGSDSLPLSSGGRYNPVQNSWTPTNTLGAPLARATHTAVWASGEMIVWGGVNFSTYLNSGGRYSPSNNSWSATDTSMAPEARTLHRAVWTGSQMIVWGGCPASGCFAPLNTGGIYTPADNSWLATNTADAPVGRRVHSALWDGSRMIVWGGCVDHDCSNHSDTGGRFDPVSNTWLATSTSGAPSGRSSHSVVWTGSEMIVWGGCAGGECQFSLQSGGRYDPIGNSWALTSTQDAASRRINHTAVWTGTEMIVWGGFDPLGSTATGSSYDPATDTWVGLTFIGAPFARDGHTAVWTGSEMIVWGGRVIGIGAHNSGGRYNPVTQSWSDTTFTDAPAAREFHSAVWTGTEMIVWGGCSFDGCAGMLNSGGRYNPGANTWLVTTTNGAPAPRFLNTALWTDSELLIWGGCDGGCSNAFGDGGRYVPGAASWSPINLSGAPSARLNHTAVWTGSEMLIWGGRNNSPTPFSNGVRYLPAGDSWSPIADLGAPVARHDHTAVWSGAEMVVWGGCTDLTCNNLLYTGGRYAPAANHWRPTSTAAFTPFGRSAHTAIWNGSEMLIWGGWKGTGSALTNTGARYCATGGRVTAVAPGAGGNSMLRRITAE
jgi:N-acetylneuraminic acid mutarotase